MKEVTIKLSVMLSDDDYKLIEDASDRKNNKGWTVNDELKMLARHGITNAINAYRRENRV